MNNFLTARNLATEMEADEFLGEAVAHLISRSFSGVGDGSKTVVERASGGSLLGRTVTAMLATLLLALTAPAATAQSSTYVPAVVASSVTTVPTVAYVPTTAHPTPTAPSAGQKAYLLNPQFVAVDACGNIYTIDNGYQGNEPITEIPAGGGQATAVYVVGNSYGVQMGQDASHKNLIVSNPYNTGVNLIPLQNCVAQSSQATKVGGGNGALFYYYNPGYGAGDFLGNTYISTNGTCCVTGQYYLVQEVNGTGNILLSNTATEILSTAIDKAQNVYFITGAAVFKLAYSGGKYAAAPVAYGSYLNPVGLSVDLAGNLYVADSSAGAIYEIPNEGTAGLNLSDQFTVSSGVNVNVAVAVNARGDMYYTAAGATNVSELTLGNSNFNTVAIGQTVTRIVNFQFNAAATVTGIQGPSGDFSIQPASLGTTNCKASSSYGPGGTTSCQVTVGYTPTSVGKQSSAVVLTYTIGGTTKTTTAFVEGIGQGAVLTVDPGVVAAGPTGAKAPAGIAVDRAGNTYVADPQSNTVTEYPVGGGAAIPVTISGAAGTPGATPLSGPLGVAVDGAGDVFIADTGNNRVLEVPFVNGALSAAGTTAIGTGMKSPSSVFVHTTGDLYVADTGNNQILVYPSFNGATNAGAIFGAPVSLGTGLSAPLAVTVDGVGNVYIADSGNNQILEYPLGGGQQIVAAGILNPSALATDSSGSLFVVDQGNFRVLRIASIAGTLSPNTAVEVGLGVAAPYGVALDASSNLYITDKTNGAAYTVARSQIALGFGNLAVGVTSNALPETVESAGNISLVFNSPYFTETGNATDFAMTSPTGACANGVTLATGASCELSATFTPGAAGARSATIAFSSNAANAPQLTLSGTGVPPSPTTTTLALVTSVAGAPFYGEPLSFTATIAPTSGTGTPTGVVSFIVDGTQFGLLPVVKGVATLQLNSGLTGGTHTVYAVYKGDPSDNGSSSTLLTVTIARAPTTPTLVITKIPYNNPYSLRHSNTGSCNVTDAYGNVAQFPAVPNDGIGFTASVTSPGVGVPSGTFTFYSDGKLINGTPNATTGLPTSVTAVLPVSGGGFAGNMTSDANTLGDGTTIGENNVLVGPHVITVVYSGDQNYLPSTSTGTTVTVTDVSSTTPVTLPITPVSPAPYCDANSTITGSRPSDPSTYTVTPSSTSVTATASTPGTVTLTFNSLSGWNGTVEMACPNLPQYTTCTFNPGQINLTSSTPGATTLPAQTVMTITTNVPTYVPTAAQGGFYWMAAVLLGLLTIGSRRYFRGAKNALTLAGLALLLLGGSTGLSGCSTGVTANAVTKPGSYPITVTFTASQKDNYGQYHTEVFRSDVPYQMSFTLTVQ
jgi:sugar lactone lactonase YvrE